MKLPIEMSAFGLSDSEAEAAIVETLVKRSFSGGKLKIDDAANLLGVSLNEAERMLGLTPPESESWDA